MERLTKEGLVVGFGIADVEPQIKFKEVEEKVVEKEVQKPKSTKK